MNFSHKSVGTHERRLPVWARIALKVWVPALAVMALLWLAVVWEGRRAEESALEEVQKETTALALLFAKHTSTTFQTVDWSLQELRDTWVNDRPTFVLDVQSHARLLNSAVLQWGVIDRKGYLQYSSLGPVKEPTYLGDREHFQVQAQSLVDKLFVSRPIQGRVSGRWSIQLTRPILRKGQFDGVLVASLNPDYFVNFYASVALGQEGVARMIRDTGEVMARSSDQARYVGKFVKTSPYGDPGAPLQGSFRRSAQVDGVDRLSSYYRLPEYGVTVLIGPSVQERLHPTLAMQQRIRAIALGITFMVAAYALLLALSYYRRSKVQAQVLEQRERLALAASVFTYAEEGILITDADGRIMDVNEAFSRVTEYTRDEVLGCSPAMLSSGRHTQQYYKSMWQALESEGHWSGEVWNRRKSGQVYAQLLTISMVRNAQGQCTHYVGLFSDISSIKQRQQDLERLANFDPLTGLPNRNLLSDRLQQAMAQTLRQGLCMAVVFIDLDGFKAVNDSHGHDVGDTLLTTVSNRLLGGLREGDTLARVGGDEFVALLVGLQQAEDCVPVLERFLAAAREAVEVNGLQLQVSASLGAAIYPRDGSTQDELLNLADHAMYRAKRAGRNQYCLQSP